MEDYKKDFINFLLENNALHVGEDRKLKSGRVSPWFVNMGGLNEASSTKRLGEAYAQALLNSGEEFDIIYGIPEKGKALAVSTAIAFSDSRPDLPWFSARKEAKDYGEYSNLSVEDRAKSLVIGKMPENGQRIAQLDDVFTDGGAKYDARRTLESLGSFEYPVLVIGVDRQEVDNEGRNAIAEYEDNTGTKVVPIVTAAEIYDFLFDQLVPQENLERMFDYLMEYGTKEAKNELEELR